tara:strand:+ start:11606 stop:11716 length:111 start_codon:yes stop_codon:yes gene_type:complete
MPPFLTLAIAATAALVIGTAIPVLAAGKRKANARDK